jgi:hypothetical protein
VTTPLQATEAVFEKVRTGWTASAFTFEPEQFTPPDAVWIRVKVQHLASGPASHGPTGGRHVQRRGRVVAQCFAPHATDDGTGPALVLADTFRALFEGIDLATVGGGSLTFEAGDVGSVGLERQGSKWIQANVSVPFTYDATF